MVFEESSAEVEQFSAITTPRMRIIPFAEKHLSRRYVSWLNDPQVVGFSDQRFRTHTLESCRQYWESFVNSPHYFWAIIARDPALGHIGNMNAYVDVNHSLADVGIVIGEKSVWGKGYGLEAWIAVCDYLLRVAGMRKLTAGTLSVNTAMLRIMKRLGMAADGQRTRQCLWNGQEVDVIHGALFRDDWLKKYPGSPSDRIF